MAVSVPLPNAKEWLRLENGHSRLISCIDNELDFERTLRTGDKEHIARLPGDVVFAGQRYGGYQRYAAYLHVVGCTGNVAFVEAKMKRHIQHMIRRLEECAL